VGEVIIEWSITGEACDWCLEQDQYCLEGSEEPTHDNCTCVLYSIEIEGEDISEFGELSFDDFNFYVSHSYEEGGTEELDNCDGSNPDETYSIEDEDENSEWDIPEMEDAAMSELDSTDLTGIYEDTVTVSLTQAGHKMDVSLEYERAHVEITAKATLTLDNGETLTWDVEGRYDKLVGIHADADDPELC
jgi:hypothetical protein